MRKFALLIPLALALGACGSFTWQNRGPADPNGAVGMQDVGTLAAQYANERKWRDVRRTMDGRTNALVRDLAAISSTIDRHLFNYSATDPYVNYETDETYYSATLFQAGSGVTKNVMPWLPGR